MIRRHLLIPSYFETVCAAWSIVSATTFGWVMKSAWLAETLVIFAPMRSAM